MCSGRFSLSGDQEGVRLANVADVQAIKGPERLQVELDGGVLGAGVGEGIGLQVADVGRDHRPAADRVQLVEDRPAERRPLGRVGAGAGLVEQDEGLLRCPAEDLRDPPDMRGEGRERLLEALLVADVGQHVVEDWQLRTLVRRDMQARLGHHRQQADRLQGHRLAARVGSGDDQKVRAKAEVDVDWDDGLQGWRLGSRWLRKLGRVDVGRRRRSEAWGKRLPPSASGRGVRGSGAWRRGGRRGRPG